MGLRLVTFLGPTDYRQVRYAWGQSRVESRFVAHALATVLGPAQVRVLATDAAWASHGATLVPLLGASCPDVVRIPLPHGQTSAQQWVQFERVREALEPDPGITELLIDITHGFRSQPFLAAAVLTWCRALAEGPLPVRVVYGAEADRGPGPSQDVAIWELPAFLDLLDWTRGLQMLVQAGRTDGVARATRATGREDGAASPLLEDLARALDAFGRDLETLQAPSLLGPSGTAARVGGTLASARADVARLLPPLAPVLDRIDAMVAPLTVPDRDAALVALARLYADLGRLPEAITITRETWLSRHAPPPLQWPGPGFSARDRERVGGRAWHEADDAGADRVSDLRNQLSHGGFRARVAADLGHQVRQAVRELEATTAPCPSSSRTVFLNLSNHPSTGWSPAQRDAALDLASTVEDLPFPQVDPCLDEAGLQDLADRVWSQVPPQTAVAMVQGEFSLTVALVDRFRQAGIPCVCATTRRDVVEDGERKISVFRFVRWRRMGG